MGLEEFTSGGDSEEQSEDQEEEEIEQEQEEQEEPPSGLDAFSSENVFNQTEEEKIVPWAEDFTPEEWNDKPLEEKVQYVRNNYWPNYRPEVDLTNYWDYEYVPEITCKCGNSFTIQEEGMCLTCGRTYRNHGEVVELIEEPGEDNNE